MNPGRARRSLGFTLIELLVTVAILAVLLKVAVPSFSDAFLSNRLAAYSNDFIASAQLARSEAIKRNVTIKLCRSSDGTSCAGSGGWQQGWIVFNDTDGSGGINGSETLIQYQQAMSADFHLTGNVYTITFPPSSAGTTVASLTLCRSTPTAGRQERTIAIGATGRPTVTTTRTGTCP